MHIPVLVDRVVEFLQPQKGKVYLDATIGCGGYTEKIFEICPECKVIGVDWDEDAIEYTKQRLAKFIETNNLILVKQNFVNIKEILNTLNIKKIDAAVLDFGMSTLQLKSNRGFSFNDESLDMRMDKDPSKITAKEIINTFTSKQLTEIFRNYGEERNAKFIAEKIVEYRKKKPISSAKELAEIIFKIKNKRYKILKNQPVKLKIHPATKIFQALRIYINNELNNIETGLNNIIDVVNSGGVIIAVSYHSLEDRIVKHLFKTRPDVEIVTKKPVVPTPEEIKKNVSARSAKLRVAKKL